MQFGSATRQEWLRLRDCSRTWSTVKTLSKNCVCCGGAAKTTAQDGSAQRAHSRRGTDTEVTTTRKNKMPKCPEDTHKLENAAGTHHTLPARRVLLRGETCSPWPPRGLPEASTPKPWQHQAPGLHATMTI